MKYLPSTPASFSAKGCSISSCVAPSTAASFGWWEWMMNPPPGLVSIGKLMLRAWLLGGPGRARCLIAAYDLTLAPRTPPPRAPQAHHVPGRSLAPAAVNHITLRNCHPERGVFSFAERGTRARRANAARFLRGNKSHAWRTSKIGVKLESREAAKECSPRRKPWVECRDDASPRGGERD